MNNDFRSRMAQYEQELLRLQQRTQAPEPPPPPTPMPSPERMLRLLVTDESTSLPIPSAVVTVDQLTEQGRLPLYVRFSDRYGRVEPLALPDDPNARYIVTAAAPGYRRLETDDRFSKQRDPSLTLALRPITEGVVR